MHLSRVHMLSLPVTLRSDTLVNRAVAMDLKTVLICCNLFVCCMIRSDAFSGDQEDCRASKGDNVRKKASIRG